MQRVFLIIFFGLCVLSSCAKCNVCLIGIEEERVCTNSVLDRAKAKSVCRKQGGEWLKIKQ